MSERVVRMEVPENCYECDIYLSAFINCPVYSVAFGYQNRHKYIKCRHPDCPIGAILPEGHGRLVDADDFIKHLSTEWENGEISNSEWCDIRQWMNEETTIVPAEAKRKVDAHDAVAPTDTPTDTPTVAAERSET